MRVISGKYKHRLINYPINNPLVRPTKDMVREALFSALGDITDFTVLDLFAGSGSLGIEALSRGAKCVYFNDRAKFSIDVVKDNLQKLEVPITQYELSLLDYKDCLSSFKNKINFNLVFLDPPYKEGKYEEIVDAIIKNDLLTRNGIIVLESEREIKINSSIFLYIKEYKYGKTRVYILWSK